ncbi:MAG: hypothetical protein AAF216_04485 [Pseudomonadota bacterium]
MNTHPHLAVLAGETLTTALNGRGIASESLGIVAGQPHATELPGDVVLIDLSCANAQSLLESYALRRPDVAMVVIGNDLQADAVRTLFRFPVSDILSSDSNISDILATLEDVSARRNQANAPSPVNAGGECWVLTGAVGGAGVTTLAIEMAFSVLRSAPARRIALVDLNLTDGTTAAFLDGQKKLDVAALCADPERIDETLVRAYSWEHPKGIFLMAAARNPKADLQASEAGILKLLDVTCSAFEHVIVDLPRHRTPWSDAIVSAADEAFVLSELTVPSLHSAADLCRDIDGLRGGPSTRLVLNRMFAKRSHRNAFPVDKAERAIHRQIDHSVRSDWESARMAVNLGLPIAQVKSRSPLVKDIDDMVEAVRSARDLPLQGAA